MANANLISALLGGGRNPYQDFYLDAASEYLQPEQLDPRTEPTPALLSGLVRGLAGGALASYGRSVERDEQASRAQAYEDAAAQSGGSTEEMARRLIANPETSAFGVDLLNKVQEGKAQIEAAREKAVIEAQYGKGIQVNSEGQFAPIAGFAEAVARTEGLESGARASAQAQTDLQYGGAIAGQRRAAELAADLSYQPKIEAAKKLAQGADPLKIAATEDELRKEISASEEAKKLSSLQTTVRGLEASRNNKDPVSDLLYSYGAIKTLDPGSIITDREIKLSKDAAGGLRAVVGNANKYFLAGKSLPTDIRDQFIRMAKTQQMAAQFQYNTVAQPRVEIGARRGGAAENIAILPIEETKPEARDFTTGQAYISAYRKWEARNK